VAIAFEKEEKHLGSEKSYFRILSRTMESKRNQLMTYLQEAGLSPVMPGGGYFIVADISTLGKYQVCPPAVNTYCKYEANIAASLRQV
jgi:kynurenine--oxoglutarate transaminase/cysteine-S-conjugate beta-lyase/glutamine--phenylpyruvate transaminase